MDKIFYKRVGLVIGGLAVVAATSIFATLALSSAKTNDKTNEFSPFTVTDTQIKETEYTVEKKEDKFVITNKNITVENPNTNISKAVYARIKVVITPKDGNLVFYDNYDDLLTATENVLSDGWVYDKGFYYYTKVIKPGEKTPELFEGGSITLNTTEECNIEVIADTVQAEANGAKGVYTTEFAIKAWGSSIPTLSTTEFAKNS